MTQSDNYIKPGLRSTNHLLPSKRGFAKSVAIHAAGIGFVVLLEITYVIFGGTNANAWVYIIFYTLDISYFLAMALLVLPNLSRPGRIPFQKVVLTTLCVFLYALLIAIVGDIMESIAGGRFHVEITKVDLLRMLHRSIYITTIGIAYWYAKYHIVKQKEEHLQHLRLLELEHTNAQLQNDYLRARVNPHFLYNVLTPLYGRLLNSDPDEADFVLSLSELMRYALKEPTEDGKVTLGEEVEYLEHLVALYRRQYPGCKIHFKCSLTGNFLGTTLPPLLFSDAVQNIFKYGDLGNGKSPAEVMLSADGPWLVFSSYNLKLPTVHRGHATGLVTMRRRLEKHYPGLHGMAVEDKSEMFRLTIKIKLLP